MSKINFRNEEDVKLKLIIPFLIQYGFALEELDFEMSFSIKVGKNVFRIDNGEAIKKSINPRLDILVKYQGRNICVFEVKADTVKIDNDDMAQAVSYGRLVTPMVPFCIISNGKESIMLDTITGERITAEKLQHYAANNYTVTLPDELYYESIKHFLGYSKNNLLIFCRGQIQSYIRTIKGSQNERDKKYIPEIYEPNKTLKSAFDAFIDSSASHCFAVIANSGMGKSCWICNLADELMTEGHPTLFYRANDIKKGIFQAITDDLNWELSPQFGVIHGMKRFFDIFHDNQVFILIDGLDEIDSDLAIQVTDEFLRNIQGRKVTFIVTCKKEAWSRLLKQEDIPTLLSEECEFGKAYYLNELDDEQYYKMIEKYKNFYNFNGLFQHDVLEDCKRNPFLLRVMFEVASSKQFEHLTYTSREFYNEYYKKILSRFEHRDSIEAILSAIGKVLYEKNQDYVDVKVIRDTINLPINESLPERLYELNVLERRDSLYGEEVGFYFSRFRDYLIAFRVLQLQNLTPEQLSKYDSLLTVSGLRLGVLQIYYVLATDEHKRVLDKPIYQNAFDFVSYYEKILNLHFLTIKKAFPPYASESIGLVGYFNMPIPQMRMHGFRKISINEPKVLLIPDSGIGFFNSNKDNLAYLYGVSSSMRMHSSMNGFRKFNISKEVLISEIPRELKKIVQSGKLDESKNKVLLHEKLLAVCYSCYPEYFGIDRRLAGISKTNFPLDKLKQAVLAERAFRILGDELIRKKVQSGEIPVTRNGSHVSYSSSLLKEEQCKLQEEAIKIANEGIFLTAKAHYVDRDEFEEDIIYEISLLEKMGEIEISDPLIIRSNFIAQFNELYWGYRPDFQYTSHFFAELLNIAIEQYRILIETNFPTLKNSFKTYGQLPLTCFVHVDGGASKRNDVWYDVNFCKSLDETSSAIVADSTELINMHDSNEVIYKSVRYNWLEGIRGDFHSIFCPSPYYTKFESRNYLLSIRSLVYSLIEDELETVLQQLSVSYGVQN